MSGFLKMSAFKRISKLLAEYYLVGHDNNKKNIQISFKDFFEQLDLTSTGGGTPIFIDSNQLPSLNNNGEPLEKGDWALITAGEDYLNINGGATLKPPLGRMSISVFNGNTWSLKDMGELPKGAGGTNGKTIEQFNATKPSGYSAGDQIFFNGDAIYEVKAGQTATTGQSPTTNPEKFDLIFTGGGLISSGTLTSNENLFLQGRISDKGVPTKDEKALYTDFIAVNKKGFTITVNAGIRFTIDKYNQNKELLEHQTTNRINTYTDSNNTSDFIRLSITKTDGSTLTPSDTSAVGLIVKTTIAKKDPLVDSVLKEFVTQNLTEVNIQDVKVSNVRLNMTEETYHSGYATTAFIAIKGLSFSIINDLTPSSTVISVVNYDKNFKKLDSFTSNGILFVENKESKIEFIRIAINNPGAIAPLSLFKLYKGFSSVTDIAKNGLEKSSEKLDSSPEFTVQLSTSIDSLK